MIHNPILKGFCPDPSIVRVGSDYYIATSTFEWYPGVNLWHSKDLQHWEQLPSPLNRTSQLNLIGNPNNTGIWAPCLSYSDGLFYLVYTDVKTQKRPYYNLNNYIVTAEKITGPWSEPVYINSTGFDPSLFHDDDGRKYFINMRNGFKGILLQGYDYKNKRLTGEVTNIFPGTEAGLTEGPHLFKKDGWYYLFVAEGGTGYEHQETVARSRSIKGPYEVCPHKLISSYHNPELFLQKAGHGQVVQAQNGEFYFVHLCSRPVSGKDGKTYSMTGRETAIQNLIWDKNGWPVIKNGVPHEFVKGFSETEKSVENMNQISNENAIKETMLFFDDFDTKELFPCWHFMRRFPQNSLSLSARKGFLRLYGENSITSMHNVTLTAVPRKELKCQVSTYMEFNPVCPEQAAGLCMMYNNENFNMLFLSSDDNGNLFLSILKISKNVYKNAEDSAEGKIPVKNGKLYLGLDVNGITAQFKYSYDGKNWKNVFAPLDATLFSDEFCSGFTGTHFAIFCHDMTGKRNFADFDWFSIE